MFMYALMLNLIAFDCLIKMYYICTQVIKSVIYITMNNNMLHSIEFVERNSNNYRLL